MIRKARIEDTRIIQELINHFASQELMLPRSLSDIYESLRDFLVYEHNNQIVACCALHIIWQGLAEIRSLVVSKEYQKRGIGKQLVNAAVKEARKLGCKSIFVLTYIPEYFKSMKFRKISKDRLPHKIWAECINCPKFPDCKEVALIKKL
jgi:amino-acid N-acetyltransferase